MSKISMQMRYYLFSFSNFLAAIGGGLILGKGISALNVSFVQSGSILAFFVGTVFGLGLLQFTPKRLGHTFSKWFSVAAALSLWMLEMTKSHLIGLSFTLFVCFLLTIIMIQKRKMVKEKIHLYENSLC